MPIVTNAVGTASGASWTNPSNVASSDNVYATIALTQGSSTGALDCTNGGFSLPANATVMGIEVLIEHSKSGVGAITSSTYTILKAGSTAGTAKTPAGDWPLVDTVTTLGSSTDLWGTTWTHTDINNSGFGIRIAATEANTGAVSLSVDQVRLRVYYTVPTSESDGKQGVNGYLTYSFLSTAAVQAASLKNSPGQVFGLQFFNTNAAARYVRLYNQTTSPAAGDTANIIWRGTIPGNTAGTGFVITFDRGIYFSSGIGLRASAAAADNDNTSLGANEIVGNVLYR